MNNETFNVDIYTDGQQETPGMTYTKNNKEDFIEFLANYFKFELVFERKNKTLNFCRKLDHYVIDIDLGDTVIINDTIKINGTWIYNYRILFGGKSIGNGNWKKRDNN